VVVVDVRPCEEFLAGHITGAISIPIGELSARMGELPLDCDVIVYCRGMYCELAGDAVRLLSAQGLRARRLIDGLTEWRLAGLPMGTD
jgi:rhodanese-related sulfurtransferase